MLYFIAQKYGICLKMNSTEEQYKISTVFPNGYKIFEASDLNDVFTNMFKYMRCRDHKNGIYMFEITNKDNEPVFVYFGTKDECTSIHDYLNIGTVVKTKINTQVVKMVKDASVATSSTIRKRMKAIPDFVESNILSKDIEMDSQKVAIPEQYFDKIVTSNETSVVKSVKEKVLEVDKDSTYMDEEIFKNMFEAVKTLKENYNRLIEQEESLRLVVKTCDYEIMDIVHDLELGFDKVSASQGYKITKRIHEVRQCRRRAKDKLEVISEMKDTFKLSMLDELTTLPERLEKRKYRNRNNTGMFDYEKVENSNLFVEMMAQE